MSAIISAAVKIVVEPHFKNHFWGEFKDVDHYNSRLDQGLLGLHKHDCSNNWPKLENKRLKIETKRMKSCAKKMKNLERHLLS